MVVALPSLVALGVERHRSFFGVHTLQLSENGRFRLLSHGTTIHGATGLRDEEGAPLLGCPEPAIDYAAGGPIAAVPAVSRRAGGAIPMHLLTPHLRADAPDPDAFLRSLRAGATVALVSRDPAVRREAVRLGWRAVTPDLARSPWTDDDAIEAMIDRVRRHGMAVSAPETSATSR